MGRKLIKTEEWLLDKGQEAHEYLARRLPENSASSIGKAELLRELNSDPKSKARVSDSDWNKPEIGIKPYLAGKGWVLNYDSRRLRIRRSLVRGDTGDGYIYHTKRGLTSIKSGGGLLGQVAAGGHLLPEDLQHRCRELHLDDGKLDKILKLVAPREQAQAVRLLQEAFRRPGG